jgi:hypothetical protein
MHLLIGRGSKALTENTPMVKDRARRHEHFFESTRKTLQECNCLRGESAATMIVIDEQEQSVRAFSRSFHHVRLDDDAACHQRSPPKLSQTSDDFSTHHQLPHYLLNATRFFPIARRKSVQSFAREWGLMPKAQKLCWKWVAFNRRSRCFGGIHGWMIDF